MVRVGTEKIDVLTADVIASITECRAILSMLLGRSKGWWWLTRGGF